MCPAEREALCAASRTHDLAGGVCGGSVTAFMRGVAGRSRAPSEISTGARTAEPRSFWDMPFVRARRIRASAKQRAGRLPESFWRCFEYSGRSAPTSRVHEVSCLRFLREMRLDSLPMLNIKTLPEKRGMSRVHSEPGERNARADSKGIALRRKEEKPVSRTFRPGTKKF